MKDNRERVEKLIRRLQDLVGIIAGRFETKDPRTKTDIERLNECVPSQLDSDRQPSSMTGPHALRILLKIVCSLLKATPKKTGLFRNVGRALASKTWAGEIDKLEKELDNSMQRYNVRLVSYGLKTI